MSAFVARPLRPLEWHNSPEAWAAVMKEWEMLRKIGTWDEATVREWRDVAREARRTGEKMHVGRIFTLCFEKNQELEVGSPARKFKGRVVFRGNDVRDENWEAAMFEELSSNPATMEAA
ncbi:MAG: hypothetical protein GY772_18020, partial [bacterium]|nr:hypothetical protein [bacterium]